MIGTSLKIIKKLKFRAHRKFRANTVLFCAAAMLSLSAHANDFPTRTITWVVHFPQAVAMDALARVVSEEMSQHLGQSIVVEYRPRVGVNIGSAHVARSKPDGHTIMIAVNGMSVIALLYPSLNFDPIKDF